MTQKRIKNKKNAKWEHKGVKQCGRHTIKRAFIWFNRLNCLYLTRGGWSYSTDQTIAHKPTTDWLIAHQLVILTWKLPYIITGSHDTPQPPFDSHWYWLYHSFATVLHSLSYFDVLILQALAGMLSIFHVLSIYDSPFRKGYEVKEKLDFFSPHWPYWRSQLFMLHPSARDQYSRR